MRVAGIGLDEVLSWLESHVNLEAIVAGRRDAPTLDRMVELVSLMAEPQRAYPVLHLTGTNGKGSTARILTNLLLAHGLNVGTYTSPNLERVNERLAYRGEPIGDDELAELLLAVASLEQLMHERASRFEILTASAFRWFADLAVDAAVVEVGLGGRWDATNVADARVALVTNVSLDHTEILGPSLEDIAGEKAGIVKPGSSLVLGETDPRLAGIFRDAGAAEVFQRGPDYDCVQSRVAHGGRLLDLRTQGSEYPDVYLPLHGAHQGDNAASALAAAECFFGGPLSPDVVEGAFANVRVPGRMEVVHRHPLCILDGAHNPAGAEAAAATLEEEFSVFERLVVVMGLLKGRDPREMLGPLPTERVRLVVASPPPSPRAMAPEDLAEVADRMGLDTSIAGSTAEAVDLAIASAAPEDLVLITGSLYLVGEARPLLVHRPW